MYRRILSAALLLCIVSGEAARAEDCASDIKSATESVRKSYVDGMGGVANSNFSMRPGTFSKIGCLDKFMKGDMDIFFRPPDLNSLLDQVKTFACEKITAQLSGSSGGGDAIGKLGDMVGKLNIPGASGASSRSSGGSLF